MNPANLAANLSEVLSQAGIPHAIGGAVAYGFWGNPRGTRDLDLNIFVRADQALNVLDTLLAGGVSFDREAAARSVCEHGDARGYWEDMPVDVFFVSIPLHESAARRTVEVELLGRKIPILSAEDLIVLKLLFFRGKDIVDVERMVALQGTRLDRTYVRRWLVDCVDEADARVKRWDEICESLPVR